MLLLQPQVRQLVTVNNAVVKNNELIVANSSILTGFFARIPGRLSGRRVRPSTPQLGLGGVPIPGWEWLTPLSPIQSQLLRVPRLLKHIHSWRSQWVWWLQLLPPTAFLILLQLLLLPPLLHGRSLQLILRWGWGQ